MYIDKEISTAFFNFSEIFGVEPPAKPDVLEWWRESLEYIGDEGLLFLMEIGFLSRSKGDSLKTMQQLMLAEIEKRQLLNTLA